MRLQISGKVTRRKERILGHLMNSISFIGNHFISLALPTALFSLLMYYIGIAKQQGRMILAAQRACVGTFALLTGATLVLIFAFLTDDFSIFYVFSYSSKSLPFFYKLTGLWAGLDGSILFWVWLVSLFSVTVLYQNKTKNADWMPHINAVMMIVILFFTVMMIFSKNPFTPSEMASLDGRGLNPLLQNIAMVIHPPVLYLGFTGFTVPFAFVIAALITRRLDSSWIEDTRYWTIVAWFFLGIGLILGGAWAYVELGWGGFWAWDPVENAGLFPWLIATAYLHSVLIEKKRDMMKVWNVSLVILTFLLTIFGTYLTRSGIVQSVHAFSESDIGRYFVVFMSLIFVASFYLVITRLNDLKSTNTLKSYFSKESSFLFNNMILVVATFAALWGTLFPTISEMVTGQRITVGQPFFNTIMAPIGLTLLLLMGVGPMISWKKTSLKNLENNLIVPFAFGVIVGVVTYVFGFRHWYVVGSFALISFVLATIILEFYRGLVVVKKQKQLSFLPGLLDLLMYSNRRYGAHIVHLGVLLIFLGIAGTVYKTDAEFSLLPGEEYTFQDYQFKYTSPDVKQDEHKLEAIANMDLYQGKKKIAALHPAKFFYFTTEQPTTEVDIYQTAFRDVYLVLGNLNPKTGKGDFKVTINPLISFLWLGGFVLLIGTIIVLMPRGWRPKKSISSALVIAALSFSLLHAQPASAQGLDTDSSTQDVMMTHTENNQPDPTINPSPNDPAIQRLHDVTDKLICMCSGCVRESLRTCTCDFAKRDRSRILDLIKSGKTNDEIMTLLIKQYGIKVLAAPPQKGFFNIGYWMPPLILIFSILFAGILVKKWHKQSKNEEDVKQKDKRERMPKDDDLAKKLSDELKDY